MLLGETMALFTPNEDGPLRYARNYQVRIAGAETNTLIGLSKLGKKPAGLHGLEKTSSGR